MELKKLSPVVTIAIIVVVVIVAGAVGFRAMQPPSPSAAIKPGVPPWQDPQYKGKVQAGRAPNDWHP